MDFFLDHAQNQIKYMLLILTQIDAPFLGYSNVKWTFSEHLVNITAAMIVQPCMIFDWN